MMELAVLMTMIALEIRPYDSSMDKRLVLSAEFNVPDTPKPLCLFFHGWHGDAASAECRDCVAQLTPAFFVVSVDMRGRGKSMGTPDVNGFELLDALDAIAYARRTWPDRIQRGAGVYVAGGSGGGGNTLAILGKAPDLFTAGVAWAGITDYGDWFDSDPAGRYRDEMEGRGWIGETPATNPQGYRARGGLYVLDNILADVLVIHGRADDAVPVSQAEKYRNRAQALGKTNIVVCLNDKDHSSEDWPLMTKFLSAHAISHALPPKGTLVVNSFVACAGFWLVLDCPGRCGTVRYELDRKGGLRSLTFSQDPRVTPVKAVRLRLFGASSNVKVKMGETTVSPAAIPTNLGYTDFTWECTGPWSVTVKR